MGCKFKEKVVGGDRAIFYKDVVNVQSGFNLSQKFPVGTVIPKGTFVEFDEERRDVHVVKSAEVVSGGTGNDVWVEKGALFQPGDEVFVDNSGKVKIQSINKNNLAHDIFTLASSLSVKEGDVLRESAYVTIGTGVVTIAENAVTVPGMVEVKVDDWVRKQGTVTDPVQVKTVTSADGVKTLTFDPALSLVSNDVLEVLELHEEHEPMGCSYKRITIEDDAETIDVVVDAKVYARRVQPIHESWFGGNKRMFLKNNPGISFTYTL